MPRDLETSGALVRKVLSLIEHYGGPDCFVENPECALMKTRVVVARLPMPVDDYCKHGETYRKRTTIWTNTGWVPKRPLCKHDCTASDGRRHTASAQRGGSGADLGYNLNELYSTPPDLCDKIAGYAWP